MGTRTVKINTTRITGERLIIVRTCTTSLDKRGYRTDYGVLSHFNIESLIIGQWTWNRKQRNTWRPLITRHSQDTSGHTLERGRLYFLPSWLFGPVRGKKRGKVRVVTLTPMCQEGQGYRPWTRTSLPKRPNRHGVVDDGTNSGREDGVGSAVWRIHQK